MKLTHTNGPLFFWGLMRPNCPPKRQLQVLKKKGGNFIKRKRPSDDLLLSAQSLALREGTQTRTFMLVTQMECQFYHLGSNFCFQSNL